MTMRLTLLIFLCLILCADAAAQYTSKKVRPVHKAYTDSLKAVEYDYVFPIWGQKVYKRGFDIPYPAGAMANYMWITQSIVIDDLQLGLKTDNIDIPLTDVSFIEFGDNSNTSYTINVRPDLWVLPFLNVYGIFGYGRSSTEVNLTYPIPIKSVVDQNISTAGIGVLAAGGVGPVWFSVDANWTWNKPELLDEPVNVNVIGLRFGHTFLFENRPDRNFALWLGGMRVEMQTETSGQIAMRDAISQEFWDNKDQRVADYYEWYDNLHPINDIGKIIAADRILTPLVERIDERDGSAVVRYGMNKQVKQRWNGTIGAQFQYNKHWMLRTEAGVFGDRKSFLLSLNYRFLI